MSYSGSFKDNLNNIKSNMKFNWQQLQIKQDFCDITIVCDDQHTEAHKLILSASSPIFKHILNYV